jgi:hypothetical protein
VTLPLIYIAAPYGSDPVGNTRRAVEDGMGLYRSGVAVPLIPHTSLISDLVCPMPAEDWYAYDLHLLERCDAVWRLPGESKGADAEVAWAVEAFGLPVFFDEGALLAWIGEWKPGYLEARLADASHRAVTATEEARVAKEILVKFKAAGCTYNGSSSAFAHAAMGTSPTLIVHLTDAEAALLDTITREART